ncbi:hypothetical protein AVEN_109246-1 [Araneus ventricosus]|uniref:Chitin-binding type-2 domain-containing protein n=1 Tax=Araneus ventricosus TaxID=182803 RepID=A0A4Y2V982_ARAVE|nr:hypothetical protein AVEN_76285-1 [Araneus ventricosus]GBO22010.1 hypothetical protein AVEN_109246-1 [Araneus ventricosus]
MFHICHENGQRSSFLCPIGTVFNQEYLVCDWWYNVECENKLNHQLADSYEAFGTSNEKVTLPSIAKQSVDSSSENEGNRNHQNKLSLFSAAKMKPEVSNKLQQKRKLNERHPNLSQKAINYPIGYAVLLREFVKNSPRFFPNRAEDSKHIENTHIPNFENINKYTNPQKSENESEKVLQKNNENSKSEENAEKETRKERNKQEYHGGSKPFSLSEKRIHESVRTKRIKIRYIPKRTQEFPSLSNPTTEEPDTDSISHGSSEEYISHAPYIPQYGAKSRRKKINTKENRLLEPINNKTIIVIDEPINGPGQRKYYNITDKFEVIHLQQSNNQQKNRLIKKYPRHRYSSAASMVDYKKEPYSDDESQFDEVDDLYGLGNETQKRNISNNDYATVSENKHSTTPVPFRKKIKQNRQDSAARTHSRSVNKNLLVTTISESTIVKKSYTVEPKISLAKLNKKYGERINTKLPASKNEKLILYATTPIFEEKVKPKAVNFIQREQFFVDKHEATTPLTPVYVHTSTHFNNVSKNGTQKKENDTIVTFKSQTNKDTMKKTLFVIPESSRKKNDSFVISKPQTNKNVTQKNVIFIISKPMAEKDDTFVISKPLSKKNVTQKNNIFNVPKPMAEKTDSFVTSKPLTNKNVKKVNDIFNTTKPIVEKNNSFVISKPQTYKNVAKVKPIFNIPEAMAKKSGIVHVPQSQTGENRNDIILKSDETNNETNSFKDEGINKNLTEFDVTSRFVSRISNLVSDIKAPYEELQQNLSAANSINTENASFTVSVRVASENFPNSTKSSSAKQLKNSADSIRTLQPWLINNSVSPKVYNYSYNDKKARNFPIQHLWIEILNKNTTKINNAHGGFIIVRKGRLKRDVMHSLLPKHDQYSHVLEHLKTKFKNLFVKTGVSRR